MSANGIFVRIHGAKRFDLRSARIYRTNAFHYLVALSVGLVGAFAGSFAAFANGSGIAGFSGAPSSGNCSGCHFFSSGQVPTVTIIGPSTVAPSSTNTFTLQLNISSTASNSVVGGFDVAAPFGTLSAFEAGTKLSSGEVVHSTPRSLSTNGALRTVSWQFRWTAPSGTGNYTIYGSGLGANGTGSSSGDAGGTTTKTVTVAVPPDTTPPNLQITSPTTSPTFATTLSTIDLAGTASDNVGVTLVTWANISGGRGVASGTTSWSISGIPLQVGDNVIKVVARDAADNTSTDTITVTRSPSSSQNGNILAGIRYLLFFGQ